MNILVVSHEFPPIGGGGANACYFLAREYALLGHQVTIVTSAYKNTPKEEVNHNLRIMRVRALRKKEEKSTFLEMFTYLCSAWCKVQKLARQEKFDICQIFFGIPSGPIGLYLNKRYQIPYVIRFGGGDIPGAQKRFSAVYKVLSPMIRAIWSNAATLVANSEGLKQRALQFESRYQIDIISNGVDNDFFTVKREQSRESSINILFVSRLIQGKGLQYIIPEMGRINKECDQLVRLTIVGDGPYREELERITLESGMSAYVSFKGKKNKQELYFYYQNADFFILPSESEGMPNVVLEAMAMGLPVIMTPCGGSDELIHGNGKIVSIENFVDAMIALCKDEESRIRFGRQSAFLTRSKFGWQEKAQEYITIFERYRL